jgi:4-amino-4-deoxy-L-arabinose transferase-like glycosyltransferase
MKKDKTGWIIIFFLALVKLILPFILQSPVYEPHRDELLYLAEGHHMAWGFMEVPPLLSVFAWLTNIFGSGIFWIKLWPSLFGAATFIIAAKIVRSLGGKNFAVFLLWLPFIFGVYLRLFFLFQPNTPEVFFWTMIAYSVIRFVQTQKNKWLYFLGASIGLGMLSKYSVALFTVSILIGLAITKHRAIFSNKHFWIASAIAFIIFLPNLLWQYAYHFPVIFHMRRLQQTQLQYINPSDFLKDQLLMHFPCLFIWLAGLWHVGFTSKGKEYRFIGWAYIIVILLLLIGHGKNYYSLGAYPVLFAFGAYHLEQYTLVKRRWLRYAFVFIPFVLGVPFIPLALPILPPHQLAQFYKQAGMAKTGALKWEDQQDHPLPQDFSDMLGWEEMAKKMSAAYEKLDSAEKKHTILFCDNYGQAGAVNFYAHKYHLPATYSDNASFLYWLPDTNHIVNLVLLTDDRHEMEHPFIKNFSSAVLNDSITTPYARERGDLIITLKGANDAFNQMFKEKIATDKAQFNY